MTAKNLPPTYFKVSMILQTSVTLTTKQEVRVQIICDQAMENEASIESILKPLPPLTRLVLELGSDTGQWLSILPSTLNDTTLAYDEFKDSLNL